VPVDVPVLLFAGALADEKAPLDLVDVVDRMRSRRPDVVLLMAGDGPLRADIEAVVGARGLGSSIRILGSRPDVPLLLSACDVVALSSRTEGMPGVVIEAGLAARPVVAYAVGGVVEVVVDGETGLLTPPRDLEGMTRGLLRIVADTDLRGRMGAAARERCLRSFEIGGVARRYLDLYRQLARPRPEPSTRVGR
jgi:glycosyltransferase involved in cell wall biosynthesis